MGTKLFNRNIILPVIFAIAAILILVLILQSKKNIEEAGGKTINLSGIKVETDLFRVSSNLLSSSGALSNPRDLRVFDDKKICILDGGRIVVMDTLGNVVGNIGQSGDGPGEYRNPRINYINGDTLSLLDMRGKSQNILLFSENGKYIRDLVNNSTKNIKLYNDCLHSYFVCSTSEGKMLYCSASFYQKKPYLMNKRAYAVIGKDSNNPLGEILMCNDNIQSFMKLEDVINPFILSGDVVRCYNNEIYILERNGDHFYSMDSNGKILEKLVFQQEPQRILASDREVFQKNHPEINIEDIPINTPVFSDFIVDNSGNYWFQKGSNIVKQNRRAEINSFEYYIFNKKFEFLGRQLLPMELKEIRNGSAYGFYCKNNGLKEIGLLKLENF